MARIIRTAGLILTNAALDQAGDFATDYWGDLALEKMFPLPFWQAKQMLAASNSNTIALRVLNITDPTAISAKWIVFEELLADSLQDPVEQGIYYFILEDKIFNGPILTATTPITQLPGIVRITPTPENNIIRGRIGKSTANEYYAFFQAAECVIIDIGGGGNGILTGAKVPSN